MKERREEADCAAGERARSERVSMWTEKEGGSRSYASEDARECTDGILVRGGTVAMPSLVSFFFLSSCVVGEWVHRARSVERDAFHKEPYCE